MPAGRPVADDELRVYRRRLPHWRLDGAPYFVTWRVERGQPDLAPDERTCVSEAIRFFDLERYELIAFVVMNDHVHVVLTPLGRYRLERVIHSWRSYTTNVLRRGGRQGRVWQPDYMDRIIRNDEELRQTAEYVLNNPVQRWPGVQDYRWVWASGMDDDE